MPKKILFIIILQMSLKGWGFYPDEVVSNKPGFAKTHRILMHKSGSKSYFKERKPCGALVPITTFVIDKLFELGMVPHTATFKLKNKDGIVMKFYENYKSLKLTAAPIFENISVAKMSDLAITRYLAGSYDTSFYNYIYNKKTKDVKAIDNDGRPLQDGVYGDWPLVNYKKKEAQLKKIDFQKHKSNELSLEEFITKLKPFISEDTLKEFKHDQSKKYSYRNISAVKYIQVEDNFWVYRRRDSLTFPHLRYLRYRTVERMKTITKEYLENKLASVKCDLKSEYISLVLKRKQSYLKLLKNDPYIEKF